MEDKGLAESIIYYTDGTNIFDNVNITLMHAAV